MNIPADYKRETYEMKQSRQHLHTGSPWRKIKPYVFSCFLLVLPILFWDALLTGSLPAPFLTAGDSQDFVPMATSVEAISKICMMALMPLNLKTAMQKNRSDYLFRGVLLYVFSWTILIELA